MEHLTGTVGTSKSRKQCVGKGSHPSLLEPNWLPN